MRISTTTVIVCALTCAGLAGSARTLAQECPADSSSLASVTVAYDNATGGSATNSMNAVTFTPSNDGTLRAADARTGQPLWEFAAPELSMASGASRRMTDIRVLRFDANDDGIIDASSGDKLWLYFGLRRGGRLYYALDVSFRGPPKVLWTVGAPDLPGVGEAWSTPTIARVRIAGAAQNSEHFVLILGGGYDGTPGRSGNRIFMVDAASGRLLWYASGPGAAGVPDLALAQMTDAIPARVAAVDIDGDGFADRLYTADIGGRVWRFDVWNGRGRADLATGGVIANLGTAPASASNASAAGAPGSPVNAQDARRFFNAPDIALIQRRGGEAYYNLALGSGDANALGDTVVHDRFYSIRDRDPFSKRAQSAYDGATPIVDADLVDITASPQDARVPPDAKGWKLDLRSNGSGSNGIWSGERALAEALTVNGVVLFTTFQPSTESTEAGCSIEGTGRVYAVRAESGAAALDLDGDQVITLEDRSMKLTQTGIAGEVRVARVPAPRAPAVPPDAPGEDPSGEGAIQLRCVVGAEVISGCRPPGAVFRTFWQRRSID